MADNIALPASGVTAATDEIGGLHYQRIKAGFGSDGSYTDVAPAAGMPTAPSYLERSGTIAANGAVAFAAEDVSAYRWAHIAISGTWSGTIRFSISADGTTWFNGYAGQLDAPWNPPVNTAANGLWGMPLNARYLRIVSTAWTSGTASVLVGFSSAPSAPGWSQVISGASSNTITDDATGFMEGKTGALGMVFDGTNWDRVRNVTAIDGSGSTGLLAAGLIGFDATASVNRRLRCDANGQLQTRIAAATTSTVTSVPASVTSVSLLPANTSRARVTVYNDSTADLYLKLGATASTASFSIKMAAGGYYETPDPIWRGVIDGIWSAADGAARVTELV